jgi:putative transposase
MKSTRHTTEQIIEKLRQADVALGQGLKVPEVCRQLEITSQTYYRWRQKYGGMAPEMAKQLKAVEKENARLKKLVAEQALDMEIRTTGKCAPVSRRACCEASLGLPPGRGLFVIDSVPLYRATAC